MKCENCQIRDSVKSSIIIGHYYRNICQQCYDNLTAIQSGSSGQAEYDRGRDAEEHEADMRQPYTDGKPDIEFIKLYPETARKLFNEEQINTAERS